MTRTLVIVGSLLTSVLGACGSCPDIAADNDVQMSIAAVSAFTEDPYEPPPGSVTATVIYTFDTSVYVANAGSGSMPSWVTICGYGEKPSMIYVDFLHRKDGDVMRTGNVSGATVKHYDDCWEVSLGFPVYAIVSTGHDDEHPFYVGAERYGVLVGLAGDGHTLSDIGPVWVKY